MGDGFEDRGTDFSGSGPVGYQPAEVAPQDDMTRLLDRQEARLFAVAGVKSVGIGWGPAGGEAIAIGVVDAGVAANLPHEIEGVPVVITVVGEVDALPQR